MEKRKALVCCVCEKRSLPKNRRRIVNVALSRYVKKLTLRDITSDDVICNACNLKFSRSKMPTSTPINDSGNTDEDRLMQNNKSPKSVRLQIKSTPMSHKYCVVCRKNGTARHSLVVFPAKAHTQAFIETGIYIEPKSRCCTRHIEFSYLTKDALNLIEHSKSGRDFSRTDITQLIHNVRNVMKTTNKLNFDIPSLISDKGYLDLTGLRKSQFAELCCEVPNLKNSNIRSTRTTVAIFLTKMRTGLSNKLLSVMFNLKKSQVQRSINSCRVSLMKNFVPKHLGLDHITHDQFCEQHTTSMAGSIFKSCQDASEAVLVLDGTYIYIQKSMDYLFQRKSYSMHKNRPLVKPMMVVGSDGYILTVFGPYYASGKNNDAEITKHCFTRNSEDICDKIKPEDVFIVDRGFRDAVAFLEEKGLKVHMPAYLPNGQKQHTVQEANLSRLVTKVRWVVESVNGRVKHWKMLEKVVPNILVPCIGDFVRIICTVINKFRPPLATSDEKSIQVANVMLDKSKRPNDLMLMLYLEEN